MLDKKDSVYVLSCDFCDKSGNFSSWEEAVAFRERLGYKAKQDSSGMYDICPQCQEW